MYFIVITDNSRNSVALTVTHARNRFGQNFTWLFNLRNFKSNIVWPYFLSQPGKFGILRDNQNYYPEHP